MHVCTEKLCVFICLNYISTVNRVVQTKKKHDMNADLQIMCLSVHMRLCYCVCVQLSHVFFFCVCVYVCVCGCVCRVADGHLSAPSPIFLIHLSVAGYNFDTGGTMRNERIYLERIFVTA